MHGSMLVVQLQNEDEVKKWVEEDPYITGKVWEKIEIFSFRIADV
jgi:uncharacterized protein YciI